MRRPRPPPLRPPGGYGQSASESGQTLTHAPCEIGAINDSGASGGDLLESAQDLGIPFAGRVRICRTIQTLYQLTGELSAVCARKAQGFVSKSIQDAVGHGA